ncbi:MAG: aminopeptidase [Gammaproteobacteria bacterium]
MLSLLLSGCGSVQYYGQAVSGHLDLMLRRTPIAGQIADPATPGELRGQLSEALSIRRFASYALGLPDNNSYRSYADLERDYVVWGVTATPALSLQPEQWCFLLVGCLSYRGYYAEADARRFAADLAGQGLDVYVGGASAYSTLGWFADPVLNTMLHRDSTWLALIMFHELAHQQLFINNDTAFNEAYAETVARAGVERWLQSRDRPEVLAGFRATLAYEQAFLRLVTGTRAELKSLYASDLSDVRKLEQKQAVFIAMRQQYAKLKRDWNGRRDYDRWFALELNNAQLAAVATYLELVPPMQRLLARLDNDLPAFYAAMNKLTGCSPAERRAFLQGTETTANCQDQP